MTEPLVDSSLSLLLIFDEPALFLLFVLKGAIIGKVLPTSLLLPGYLLTITATLEQVAVSITVASVGYVTGQLLVYWLSSNYGLDAIDSLPTVSVSDAQVSRAESLFRRYSGAGIFVTNLVPYVGSFIMIPAGMSSYPVAQTVLYALSSTLLNYVLIVWLAFESIELLGAF